MSDIVSIAADIFNVREEDILSPSRKRRYTKARQALYYVLRRRDHLTLSDVAARMKRGDHNTVMSGIAQCEARMKAEPFYAAQVRELMECRVRPPAAEALHPAVLTKRIKPKNEHVTGDRDARMRMHGSFALLRAIEAARAAA